MDYLSLYISTSCNPVNLYSAIKCQSILHTWQHCAPQKWLTFSISIRMLQGWDLHLCKELHGRDFAVIWSWSNLFPFGLQTLTVPLLNWGLQVIEKCPMVLNTYKWLLHLPLSHSVKLLLVCSSGGLKTSNNPKGLQIC